MKYYLTVAGLMFLTGCVRNQYKIQTVYMSPADNAQITSEIQGIATPGRISHLYQEALKFVNKEYIKK